MRRAGASRTTRRAAGSRDAGKQRRESAPRRKRDTGFTLVELVMVILILGILFTMTTVSLSGLTPIYKVRSSCRVLAGKIEEIRAIAIARGLPMGIRYNLSDPQSYQIIPPASDDYPDEPIEIRKLGTPSNLPDGVFIRKVSFPSAGSADRGSVNVIFSPMGNTGSHVVTLEGKSKEGQPIVLSLKFNAITGTVDFAQGEAEIQQEQE